MTEDLSKIKIRYKWERTSLSISIFLLLVVTFIIFQLSLKLVLIAIVFQLCYIIVSQRQLIGNSLHVDERQFTDIHNIIIENASTLDIKLPKVYIVQDPYINAYTIGFQNPYAIVLTSALVESLSRNELDFVLGHELAHIKYGHSQILSFISPIGKDIPFISWFYGSWQRRAEYTADRAGMVVTKEIKPAITAMLKMTVGEKLSRLVNIDEIVEQIQDGSSGIITKSGEFLLNHPYTTNRIKQLVMFAKFNE